MPMSNNLKDKIDTAADKAKDAAEKIGEGIQTSESIAAGRHRASSSASRAATHPASSRASAIRWWVRSTSARGTRSASAAL
jgi:hypothetical protein